jgi:F-type H+-transporting ATPase subunit delta
MINRKVASRYASSLIESSKQKGSLEVVAKDIELVVKTLEDNSQLKKVLETPVVRPAIKKSILEEVFQGSISRETSEFLSFSVEKGRENLLYDILLRFLALRDEHFNIVNVELKAAFEFTPEQEKELKKKLEETLKKSVRIKLVIDKEIIGGFIAKVGDTVYDASLKHQLDLLKKQFMHGGASLN